MPSRDRVLVYIAWLNVVLHAFALALAAFGMRPGTPAVPFAERVAYLASDPPGWLLGWGAWMLCVPALIAFFAMAARRVEAGLARLAVVVAIVGAGIDLTCDVIFLVAFPRVAAADPLPMTLFLTMERATGAVSLIVANGLYSIASLLLTIALHGKPGVSPWAVATGYGVAGFGLLLAAAGFTGVPWHIEWATGPTIGLFCIWTVLVARSLDEGEVRS